MFLWLYEYLKLHHVISHALEKGGSTIQRSFYRLAIIITVQTSTSEGCAHAGKYIASYTYTISIIII